MKIPDFSPHFNPNSTLLDSEILYKGHGKIYAYQEWGSTKQNYEKMNTMSLPEQYMKPSDANSVSILVSSLNTKAIASSFLSQLGDDFPNAIEDYIHRIGRSGRAG
jgi:hypothetical protein